MKIKNIPKIEGGIGWFEILKDKDNPIGQRLKDDIKVDICIVGAGIAGFSVALSLHKHYPNAQIALIDALKIGLGTSSRCAGFIIDLPHNLDGNKANIIHDKKIYDLNCFAIKTLEDLITKHNIDCQWSQTGKYMCAHEKSNLKGLDIFEQHLKPNGFKFERIKGARLHKLLGTEYYKEAIYTPNNILMNPSGLLRGLIKSLPQEIRIFDQSPIIEWKNGDIKILKSYGGSISCNTLVLTLDSFLEEFGIISNKHAPIFTYGSLTEQLNEEEYQKYFAHITPYGLTSAHPAGTTVRFTPDRRIFIRNILNFFSNLTCSERHLRIAFEQHRRSFEARFPHLKHKRFEFTWGGMLCMSLNHQGIFGEIDKNVYAIGASNGVGMAKGVYLGHYLADLIAGVKSENLSFILKHNKASFVPPEPLRSIGAKMRLWYEQKKAKGDI